MCRVRNLECVVLSFSPRVFRGLCRKSHGTIVFWVEWKCPGHIARQSEVVSSFRSFLSR